MPSETFPTERILTVIFVSLCCFWGMQIVLENFLLGFLWSGWAKLDRKMQRAFTMRCVSVTHSAITAYNGLQTLLDTNLQENVLQGVTDNHFWTASVLSGYFVYDTIISFTNLAAEDDAAGAIQTLVHHLFVLGTLPVGLYTNTWGWIGSGVLAFWTEVTGPCLNAIWILRTLGLQDHWIYPVNGLVFGVAFCTIRVFVLGYYSYVNVAVVYAHLYAPPGPVTIDLWAPSFIPDSLTFKNPQVHEHMECAHFLPRMEKYGSCQFGMWLCVGLWGVSLLWVPAVVAKVYRGVAGFLAPTKTD